MFHFPHSLAIVQKVNDSEILATRPTTHLAFFCDAISLSITIHQVLCSYKEASNELHYLSNF